MKVLSEKDVGKLFSQIAADLNLYRVGDVTRLIDDKLAVDMPIEIEDGLDGRLSDGYLDEVTCCLLIHKGIKGLDRQLARDYRFWVTATHSIGIEYVLKRWKLPEDDEGGISQVQRHFFGRGARGIERDNALSRLWWLAELCNDVDGVMQRDALDALLEFSDVRANLIERPNISLNKAVFSAVVRILIEGRADPDKRALTANRSCFRAGMKALNLLGGTKLLSTIPERKIVEVFERGALLAL